VAEGVRCAYFDLVKSGSQCAEVDWYADLVSSIAESLGIPSLYDRWSALSTKPMDEAWLEFLRADLLATASGLVVVCLDEIDLFEHYDFAARFFAALGRVYHLRREAPASRRLTFCLLGVMPPEDLVPAGAVNLVPVWRQVRLRDFTHAEAQAFVAPLASTEGDEAAALLERVLWWAGGNPYMVQRLCKHLAESTAGQALRPAERVDLLVRELLLTGGPDRDNNLAATEQCFTPRSTIREKSALLDLYERVLKGESLPPDAHGLTRRLGLTGIVAEEAGAEFRLRPRNRVFEEVFGLRWVERKRVELGLNRDSVPRGRNGPASRPAERETI
jgi:hypothetical protein